MHFARWPQEAITFTTQGGQKETQSYAFNVDAASESDKEKRHRHDIHLLHLGLLEYRRNQAS